MLTIWGRRTSLNVQKVMWLVGELGIKHRRIDAGCQFGGLDTPEFRAMNPLGRVPVLGDDDARVAGLPLVDDSGCSLPEANLGSKCAARG
jgi:glutathione S-transferase